MDHLCALQRDFINLRLGTFIHWNSAAVQFHANPDIIDWEFDLENGGEPRRYPFPESDWAPRAPDCSCWAQIAKSAGCRFAVLTAKHHEGFALWPSEFGNHSVAQATVRTDIVAEFLRAFRAAGLQAGLYFSVLDLTTGIGRRSFTPAQRELVLGQITELLTNYGEIPYLIIDGWNAPWGGPSYRELPFEEVDALVKRLQEAFEGDDVVTLCHDYYYKAHPELTYEERTKLNYDHPQAFDTQMLVDHIKALKENVPIEHPVYSFVEHNRMTETVSVKPSKVIIVDGILIFENKELRDLMDIKVYVDTDADIRLARRILRDVCERGRTMQSVITQYTSTVKPMHEEFVEPSKKYADVIIPEGGFNSVAVAMLIQNISSLIARNE